MVTVSVRFQPHPVLEQLQSCQIMLMYRVDQKNCTSSFHSGGVNSNKYAINRRFTDILR